MVCSRKAAARDGTARRVEDGEPVILTGAGEEPVRSSSRFSHIRAGNRPKQRVYLRFTPHNMTGVKVTGKCTALTKGAFDLQLRPMPPLSRERLREMR